MNYDSDQMDIQRIVDDAYADGRISGYRDGAIDALEEILQPVESYTGKLNPSEMTVYTRVHLKLSSLKSHD